MTKIESAQKEYSDWCSAIGIENLDDVNNILNSGLGQRFVNICEARQERKYAEAADQIVWNAKKSPIVMMSGPSSSGKTSSSLRIAQQCIVLGVLPKVLELDNYFVNREDTPLDENGEYDYEALGAMDIKFLGEQLNALLSGEEIEVPKFDFIQGKRIFDGKKMRLEEGDLLFMEGIHALNPALTPSVDQEKIYHIYISTLSALPGPGKDHGSTTSKRLARRIIRDHRTRGITPEETILRWPSVRRGEIRNIFPYEENADLVFNSSMLYDLPLLKRYVEPLINEIPENSAAFPTVQAMKENFNMVRALNDDEISVIPATSIMREFIGGQVL